MPTLDLPTITPDGENWTLEFNTQTFTSDLNGAIQTAELPGARWSVSMTFSNRFGRAAWALQATLAKLAGRAGRFYVTPADWEDRAGNASGTGAVATDASGGTSIDTDGWDINITDLFYAGSYFEVNGELKMVTADVDSDGTGLATIEFSPPLRKAVTDGMQIRHVEPRAIMMLSDDSQANWGIQAPAIYAVTIDAMEALDI
tara:strand:+ start:9279 stop:9884 length:606 start_codon:yes stop_codon:yes gene_type:complete